ncbi:insulinase family protein [Sphingomonas sp. AP4-R1]|uniref:M16 family metallopeptidase n=1 Tax=Sphingomonas sp. AP4-R1 TaxID=2735134 RepID=UPI001493A7B7|nr:pitrilysin family protein [Sphingomonas sp. AP4-R1]QJU59663.1 insulinase family protein [Sphingomonas sp. AP4-R1]
MKSVLALALSATMLAPLAAATAAAPAAPVSDLVAQVKIPYEEFTLKNGLRVIVHTDRKVPLVAVSVWYHIGSRDEPKGKTGFAHLYEHLMFYGSENASGSTLERLESLGATDWNGTTWFDRTNYFETVPKGALDRTLFLESDRMGHLLGVVNQERLDAQRGVVQNEKRMGENEPGGLVQYAELDALFPEGHPYRHSTIGSMADLNGASLNDVKGWFRDNYGPNNAVLVLAGDIDLAEAKAKVEKWFGAIPRGPEVRHPAVSVPTLPAPVDKVMYDHVATASVSREWVTPGIDDPESTQIQLASYILGGLGSSRLQNILVRQEKLAVSVSAGVQQFEKVGMLEVNAKVRPGVDPALVARRMDEILADYLKTGPSADEVQRAATSIVAGQVRGLEQVGGFGGKAVTLAEGAVYSNDPAHYQKELREIAEATPQGLTAVARKWMGRPALRLMVLPGERSAADQALAGNARHPAYFRAPEQGGAPAPATPSPKSSPAPVTAPPAAPKIAEPPLAPIGALAFPKIERATLSNGIPVTFARRAGLPLVQLALQFDAGNAADDKAKLGTQALLRSLLKEGTKARDSNAIAEEQERLGAAIGVSSVMDATRISLSALKPNLGASLDLFADIVLNPALAPAEIERQRARLLAAIATEKTQPQGIAMRTLPPILFGKDHPYGVPFSGSGDESGVTSATRADLVAFRDTWLRPDNAKIFAVGDTTLAELMPQLEARFGGWKAPATPKGVKDFAAPVPAARPRIVLVDKPQSPQSMIMAGLVTPLKGTDDIDTIDVANDVLGGSTASRLTNDLRETRHWAYYAGSQLSALKQAMPLLLIAPVQADKTGEAIAAARGDVTAYLGAQGTTPAELARSISSFTLSLPGQFETSGALLGALMRMDMLKRPDDYYVGLPAKYRAMTTASVDKSARDAIDPAKLVWVIVGDAKVVRPQLQGLGLPIEDAPADPASTSKTMGAAK